MRANIANLTLDVPAGWFDVTDELPVNSPPTLAPESGLGTVQFTVASYQAGERPRITEASLSKMFSEFCNSHHLHAETACSKHDLLFRVSGISRTADELIAVWYISDGDNVALITYTNLEPENAVTSDELRTVESLIDSIGFLSRATN